MTKMIRVKIMEAISHSPREDHHRITDKATGGAAKIVA